MARDGIDFSTLSRGERIVLGAGVLMFANAFVPWWFRVETPARTYFHSAGLTGWSVAAPLLAFTAAVGVLIRASRFPNRGPADGTVYTILGVASLAALVVEALRGRSAWIGLWIAIPIAVALTYGGWRRRAERRRGWI